jgi:putative transposase
MNGILSGMLAGSTGGARSTFCHKLSAFRKAVKHQTLKEKILNIYHYYRGYYGYDG